MTKSPYRFRILFLTGCITVTLIIEIFFPNFFPRSSSILPYEKLPTIAALLFGAMWLAGWMLKYLKSARNSNENLDKNNNNHWQKLYIDEQISAVQAAIHDKTATEFSESDKATVLKSIQAKLESDSVQDYVNDIRETITSTVKKEILEKLFSNMIRRLDREADGLDRRGDLNLVIGTVTAFIGVSTLAYSAYFSPQTQTIQDWLAYFLPRFSLVIIIQIFAYFFLRLYKQNLSEIKYFQNEITNIESRQLALNIAMSSDEMAVRNKILIENLSNTERNFILEKNQTTVDLERDRLDQITNSNLTNVMKDILKRKSDG